MGQKRNLKILHTYIWLSHILNITTLIIQSALITLQHLHYSLFHVITRVYQTNIKKVQKNYEFL